MAKSGVSSSRRGFLISVGTGSVAAAAAAVSAVAPETVSEADQNDQRSKRGYRVSEHINKYYRTTRV
ncbi:MAG: formate dehydrogenase [Betaproteobacteria bacterium]|nr:MAG: formate dehydrogenase [Betaproteobacteria bacterium]